MTAVRRGEPGDRAPALATLTAAFAADPLLRWVFPDDAVWPERAAGFFGYLFDSRVSGGGEVRVTDDVSAVSLWNPPGGNRLSREQRAAMWERETARFTKDEHARFGRFVETVTPAEPPQPFWYLGVVGIDPARKGEGLGARVLEPLLEQADDDELPAYLETATERNLGFYGRLGFRVHVETDVPGGPHLWGLLREPAAR